MDPVTTMKDPGPYATWRGEEYALLRIRGRDVLLARTPTSPGPEWERQEPAWLLPVGPEDVEEIVRYTYPGEYRVIPVDVGPSSRGRYQLWIQRKDLPRNAGIGEYYDQWLVIHLVDADDPDLTFHEVRRPTTYDWRPPEN